MIQSQNFSLFYGRQQTIQSRQLSKCCRTCMAVGLNVMTAYVWPWAGICTRLGLTSNTSCCFAAFPPELDLTVNTTSQGTYVTNITTLDWRKCSWYMHQKISVLYHVVKYLKYLEIYACFYCMTVSFALSVIINNNPRF